MDSSSWPGELRIGIGVFDREHRHLADAVNELQAAVEAGNNPAATVPLLNRLAANTIAHFKAEEAMMASAKYPALALHALKHQRLREQFSAFQARHDRGEVKLDCHSLNFLRDWVATHIQSEDLTFALWLNEHGKR